MNETLIRCHARGVLVATILVLLVAIPVGCQQQGEPPESNASISADDAAQVGTAEGQPEADPAEGPLEPIPADEAVEVGSCDGTNTATVAKGMAGQPLADALMDQWLRDHPEANWVAEEKQKHAFNLPADNSDLLQGEQGEGHAYGNFTELDLLTWTREAEKFVAEGSRIFHSADELGSSVAVSCDMCHPHASNTHPETYPKFQTQLGRVALLRDMINWCIENPVRGEPLEPDGPTMRALEAYIMAQRQGVEMNYGKH